MRAEERIEMRVNNEGLDAGKQKYQCNPSDYLEILSKLAKAGLSEEINEERCNGHSWGRKNREYHCALM